MTIKNRHGAVEIDWAGGEHTFRLGLGEIEELEAATDMSVFVLYAAMSSKIPLARAQHYRETIRLGLIGGGDVKPVDAKALVKKWVDERPLAESVALAEGILRAGLERVYAPDLDDQSGEAEAPKSPASTSAPSTETPS